MLEKTFLGFLPFQLLKKSNSLLPFVFCVFSLLFRWLIFQWSWLRPFEEPTMGNLCPTCSATCHCSPVGCGRWSKPPPTSHCLCLPAVLALGLSNSRMITGKSIRSMYTLRLLVSPSNVQDYCFSVCGGRGRWWLFGPSVNCCRWELAFSLILF